MPRYRCIRSHLCLIALGSLLLSSSSRANYLLFKLFDNTASSPFSSFTDPVINNNDQVGIGAVDRIHSGGSYYRYDLATQQLGYIFSQSGVLTPQMGDNGELAWQLDGGGSNTPI